MDSGWREGRKVEAAVAPSHASARIPPPKGPGEKKREPSPEPSATSDVRSFSPTSTGEIVPLFSLLLSPWSFRSCEKRVRSVRSCFPASS